MDLYFKFTPVCVCMFMSLSSCAIVTHETFPCQSIPQNGHQSIKHGHKKQHWIFNLSLPLQLPSQKDTAVPGIAQQWPPEVVPQRQNTDGNKGTL